MAKKASIFSHSKRNQSQVEQLSFTESFKALKHLPPFLKLIWETNRRMTLANIVLRVIQAGIPVTVLYIGKLIIDEVILLSNDTVSDPDHLWTLVAVEFGLVILTAIMNKAVSLMDSLLGDLVANSTSVKLIGHAAQMDLPQFEDPAFYDKLERARRQTSTRVALFSQLMKQGQEVITIFFLGAGLVVFNPWLIILLIIAVIPSFLTELHFNQRTYSLSRTWTPERRQLDYLRYIGASDITAKEVKIFGLSPFIKDRYRELADTYYEANKNLAIKRATWGLSFNTLSDVGYYVAYILIIIKTIDGTLSIGDLTFLSGSFSRMRNLLRGVLVRFSSIAQNALYLKDLFDFFDIVPQIQSPSKPIHFPKPLQEGFSFENVGFAYPNSKKFAVRNLNFHLAPGEKMALVGENGAGKTTLVKLIARLYDPTEGVILLDGKDLRSYDLFELRKAIGVIFQDYVRYNMTMSENIATGNIDERENNMLIHQASELSLADSVVANLENGYDQMLGRRFEGGTDLSGGQWQKVALARSYMREAQLVILDEPTAALDARAEFEVFERFTRLTEGKAAFIISHRFSTVRMADRILVLKNGEMSEIGTHSELLASGGLYAELFNLQAQGYK